MSCGERHAPSARKPGRSAGEIWSDRPAGRNLTSSLRSHTPCSFSGFMSTSGVLNYALAAFSRDVHAAVSHFNVLHVVAIDWGRRWA